MARVVFFILPEPGHVLPTIAVARALVRMGHSVTYLCVRGLERYFIDLGFSAHVILPDYGLIPTTSDVFSFPQGRIVQLLLFNRCHPLSQWVDARSQQ